VAVATSTAIRTSSPAAALSNIISVSSGGGKKFISHESVVSCRASAFDASLAEALADEEPPPLPLAIACVPAGVVYYLLILIETPPTSSSLLNMHGLQSSVNLVNFATQFRRNSQESPFISRISRRVCVQQQRAIGDGGVIAAWQKRDERLREISRDYKSSTRLFTQRPCRA
jgi:hypothetical protein